MFVQAVVNVIQLHHLHVMEQDVLVILDSIHQLIVPNVSLAIMVKIVMVFVIVVQTRNVVLENMDPVIVTVKEDSLDITVLNV